VLFQAGKFRKAISGVILQDSDLQWQIQGRQIPGGNFRVANYDSNFRRHICHCNFRGAISGGTFASAISGEQFPAASAAGNGAHPIGGL